MPNSDSEEEKFKRAQARVRRVRNFYSSLITYILVNLLLLVINLVSSPNSLWFYWVAIIWGFVIIVQAFNTFTIKDRFLGDEWEQKKIDELMDKEKPKKNNKKK